MCLYVYLCVYLCMCVCCVCMCISVFVYICVFVCTHSAVRSPALSALKCFPPSPKGTPYPISTHFHSPSSLPRALSLWVPCSGSPYVWRIHSVHDLHLTTGGRFVNVSGSCPSPKAHVMFHPADDPSLVHPASSGCSRTLNLNLLILPSQAQ